MPPGPTRAAAVSRAASRVRRRRLVAFVLMPILIVAPLAALRSGRSQGRDSSSTTNAARTATAPGTLRLRTGDRSLGAIGLRRFAHGSTIDAGALRDAVVQLLPRRIALRRGRARIVATLDRDRAARRAIDLGMTGGAVDVPRENVAARIGAPVIAQKLRNNCESAALSILLATQGVEVDQLTLQRQLPRSGPADPDDTGPTRVWGDPERGYVGRVRGGGIAGGFGVYEGPVAKLATRHGVATDDLTGATVDEIRKRILTGRPVMVWIGLSAGPYGEWLSPSGRRVEVNFGEHTLVLTGVDELGRLEVVNPLEGTRERLDPQTFEGLWQRLDRRALAVRARPS